jgi:hypothetical protein
MSIEENAFDSVETDRNRCPLGKLPDDLLSHAPHSGFKRLIPGDVPAGEQAADPVAASNDRLEGRTI